MIIDTQMAADEPERRANSIELEISKTEPPIPAPRQEEQAQEVIDPKYLELLEKLGFTEIPTAEQVKAKLDERRAEIRAAVMEQADIRGWCEDGTRQVCANLRLPRPGRREAYVVRVPVAVEVETTVATFAPQAAIGAAHRNLSSSATSDYLRRALGASAVTNVTFGDAVVLDSAGNPIETPGGAA